MKTLLFNTFERINQKVEGVAFSVPGTVDVQKQMINGISAIPYLHKFNIFEELEELFDLPLAIENDANLIGSATNFRTK